MMVEVAAGGIILPAKEGAPHAAADAVAIRRIDKRYLGASSFVIVTFPDGGESMKLSLPGGPGPEIPESLNLS